MQETQSLKKVKESLQKRQAERIIERQKAERKAERQKAEAANPKHTKPKIKFYALFEGDIYGPYSDQPTAFNVARGITRPHFSKLVEQKGECA